jgi:type IV pilus assembly protein PilA
VVIAMIGVMSALAVVGYRKYVNAAQASEAKAMIQAIRVGEEAYKAEMLVYVGCSSGFGDFYPKKPDDTKMNWIQPADSRYTDPVKGWRLLNVQADGPVRFGYTVQSGIGGSVPQPPNIAIAGWPPVLLDGAPWYVVQATNQRPGSSRLVVFVGGSFTSETFSENDAE